MSNWSCFRWHLILEKQGNFSGCFKKRTKIVKRMQVFFPCCLKFCVDAFLSFFLFIVLCKRRTGGLNICECCECTILQHVVLQWKIQFIGHSKLCIGPSQDCWRCLSIHYHCTKYNALSSKEKKWFLSAVSEFDSMNAILYMQWQEIFASDIVECK